MDYYKVYTVNAKVNTPDDVNLNHGELNWDQVGLFVETRRDGSGYFHEFHDRVHEYILKYGRNIWGESLQKSVNNNHYGYRRTFVQSPVDTKFVREEYGVTPKDFYPDQWDSLLQEPPFLTQWGKSEVNVFNPEGLAVRDFAPQTMDAELWRRCRDVVELLTGAGLLMTRKHLEAPPLRTTEMMFEDWQKAMVKKYQDKVMANDHLKHREVPWHAKLPEGWPVLIRSTDLRMCVVRAKYIKRLLNDVLRFAKYNNETKQWVKFDGSDIQIEPRDRVNFITLRATWAFRRGEIYNVDGNLMLGDAIEEVIRIMRDWHYARLAWSELHSDAQRSPTLIPAEIMKAVLMLPCFDPQIEQVWDLIDRIDPTEELSRECEPEDTPKY